MRDVIGQRVMVERLGARALAGDLGHAYGLFGPRSIGKRTVAIRLAQTLNCTTTPRLSGGCGTCRACVNIERGAHPDVRMVERAADRKDILIEQIVEMQTDLALRPLEGRARVVIIDDAGEMNEFVQEALLETLEGPRKHPAVMLIPVAPISLHE